MNKPHDLTIWKVHVLREFSDSGRWYFSGPFSTHEIAEEFAVAQGSCPDVLSVLITVWEDEKEKPDLEVFRAMFKDAKNG